MSNDAIIALLAKALTDGFIHPGDESKGTKPTPIVLPFKARAGMPEEMGKLLTNTAQLLAECIVSTIEVEGASEIVPKTEAKAMRRAVGKGGPNPITTPVYCRCDTNRTDPLLSLGIVDPDAIIVHGPSLIRQLAQRSVKCPHDRIETS